MTNDLDSVSVKIGVLDERSMQMQKKLDEHCENQDKFMTELRAQLSPIANLPARVEKLEGESSDQKVGRAKAAGILIGASTAMGAVGSQIQDFIQGIIK